MAAHPALRSFLFANACWELSLSALKTFIVLYLTVGLGQGITTATGLIAAVAAIILRFGTGANGQGLKYTFLIMLSALLLSGLVMVRARRSYPRDVATALASERGAGSIAFGRVAV